MFRRKKLLSETVSAENQSKPAIRQRRRHQFCLMEEVNREPFFKVWIRSTAAFRKNRERGSRVAGGLW